MDECNGINDCAENTVCLDLIPQSPGDPGYTCPCQPGYKLNEDTQNCEGNPV